MGIIATTIVLLVLYLQDNRLSLFKSKVIFTIKLGIEATLGVLIKAITKIALLTRTSPKIIWQGFFTTSYSLFLDISSVCSLGYASNKSKSIENEYAAKVVPSTTTTSAFSSN